MDLPELLDKCGPSTVGVVAAAARGARNSTAFIPLPFGKRLNLVACLVRGTPARGTICASVLVVARGACIRRHTCASHSATIIRLLDPSMIVNAFFPSSTV